MSSDFAKYGPRGEPTWADWKNAEPGTRVRHVRTGATGTFVRKGGGRPGAEHRVTHATVDWDDRGFGVSRGRVVAPAFDLEPAS